VPFIGYVVHEIEDDTDRREDNRGVGVGKARSYTLGEQECFCCVLRHI
jgi:hypothetical protein